MPSRATRGFRRSQAPLGGLTTQMYYYSAGCFGLSSPGIPKIVLPRKQAPRKCSFISIRCLVILIVQQGSRPNGATRGCPVKPTTPQGPDQVNVLLLYYVVQHFCSHRFPPVLEMQAEDREALEMQPVDARAPQADWTGRPSVLQQ
jgi:hypothetical protein